MPKFGCVLTNVVNSISAWIWESAFFDLLRGHTWVCGLQGGKTIWSEKNFNDREHAHTKNTQGNTGFQWDGPILLLFYQELCLHHGPHYGTFTQNKGVCVDYRMLGSMGGYKIEVFGHIDINSTQMGQGVSYPSMHQI